MQHKLFIRCSDLKAPTVRSGPKLQKNSESVNNSDSIEVSWECDSDPGAMKEID
jgi:hypothetical protein